MKALLLVLALLANAPNKMPIETEWVFQRKSKDIEMKSTVSIWKKRRSLDLMIYNIKESFTEFSGYKCNPSSKLNIFIISEENLNNPKIFSSSAGPEEYVFGRYFREGNNLYITPEFLDKPEFMAHELTHFFFDECRDNLEENIAYKFQEFYRKKHVRSTK